MTDSLVLSAVSTRRSVDCLVGSPHSLIGGRGTRQQCLLGWVIGRRRNKFSHDGSGRTFQNISYKLVWSPLVYAACVKEMNFANRLLVE